MSSRRRAGGPDFLQLDIGQAPPRGVTTWLTAALRTAITDGRLTPGSRLPATRTLAEDLGIARGVVVEAYERLGDEGLVDGRTGVGTVVVERSVPGPRTRPGEPAPDVEPLRWRLPLLAARRRDAGSPETNLSPGLPDLAAFPRGAWLRAERAVLDGLTPTDLGYGDPQGEPRLRRELATWLARVRGTQAEPDDVIVVAGVAQALALLAQVLASRGATSIAVEDPCSRGARDQMAHWGLRAVPIPVDRRGVQVEELVRSGEDAVLLTPAHQFPTGVVLAPERRRALLDWLTPDRLVLEDDYDAEHRYDRAPVPALQASAPEQVAHTGSTSKTLAPGMRLGWLLAPRHLRADLVAAKHATDLGCPGLPQLVLAHLLATGAYDRHLRQVRTRQRRRRDAVLSALREHCPQAQVEGVEAGLHVLITLPHLSGGATGDETSDGVDIAIAQTIRDAGIIVQPLSWHRQRPGPPGIVLGYAAYPPEVLRDAVRRLARHLA